MPDLAPRRRLALLALGYTIYVACSPGMLFPGGSPLGALGLVPWALATSRPGPRKKLIEGLTGGAAFVAQTTWMGIVFWFAIPWLFVGYTCWAIWGGWLSKRLARRLPLALATPLAWIGFESLLAWTPPPIGLSWLRLGHYLADWPALAGSGRVWGVAGLGFVLAALAGLAADLLRARRERSSFIALPRLAWIAGLGPALAAAVLAVLVPVPETQPGPRLLLVQPAFEQARKQLLLNRQELFGESYALTLEALDDLSARAERAPDLVVWGESMLPYSMVEPGLAEVVDELEIDPWHPWAGLKQSGSLVDVVESWNGWEREVLRAFYDSAPARPAALPPGTHFLAGVDLHAAHEGRLRRVNAVILWNEQRARVGTGRKQHLAPGGETMVGLEAFEVVRDIIFEVANYVPDLLPGERIEVLHLPGPAGERWAFGASVCFDNAFSDAYAGPLRREATDFHLVVSNEAWYRDSQELDQMIAFSRLHALCTARSFVRCANSGVSAAFGPDGRELARLVVDGSDREVRGTLVVDVPVPVSADPGRTPFVWLEPWLLPGFALLAAALAIFGRPAPVRSGDLPRAAQ